MLLGAAGCPADGVATHSHSYCRMTSSTAAFRAATTARRQVFLAAAVILSPAPPEYGRQFTAAMPRLRLPIGTLQTTLLPRTWPSRLWATDRISIKLNTHPSIRASQWLARMTPTSG